MSRNYNNDKGIVLITTLMLMMLGFAIVVTLLWLVTYGTKLSGLERRYATALEASKGGVEFIVNMIRNEIYSPPALASAAGPSSAACVQQKLTRAITPCSPAPCSPSQWSSCAANSATSDPAVQPDVTLSLANYNVFIKIVDTKESDNKYFYTVNVRSIVPNTREYAEISFLYEMDK